MKPFVIPTAILTLICLTAWAYGQTPRIIDVHFNALTSHDVKAIVAGYSGDAKVFSPNWEGAKTGATGITEVYTRYFSSTPDLAYKVLNTINAGDNVVVEKTSDDTLSNPESGTPDYMKGKKNTQEKNTNKTQKNNKKKKESDNNDQLVF